MTRTPARLWIAAGLILVGMSSPAPAQDDGAPTAEQLDRLILWLQSGTPTERQQAAEALTAVGAPAIPRLLATFADPTKVRIRSEVTRIIGAMGPAAEKAIPDLKQIALHAEPRLQRLDAVEALGRIGPAAAPALINVLSVADEEVSYRAVTILSRFGPGIAPQLLDAMDARPSREGAVRVLAQLAPALEEAEAPRVRQALLRRLDDRSIDVRVWSVRALGRMGPAAGNAVKPLLRDTVNQGFEMRYEITIALARQAPTSVPALLASLDAEAALTRTVAARALGMIQPPVLDAIQPLIQHLNDPDDDVAFAAAEALANIGPPAIPTLVTTMAGPDENTRRGAAYALGNWRYRFDVTTRSYNRINVEEAPLEASLMMLNQALLDRDVNVRRTSASSLARLCESLRKFASHTQDTIVPLTEALESSDATLRYRAARALAVTDPTKALLYEQKAREIAETSSIIAYHGFHHDRQLLQLKEELNGPLYVAASIEAQTAAKRVFLQMPWLGWTRAQIIEVVGPPTSAPSSGSDAAAAQADRPIIYKFGSGDLDDVYILSFRKGVVVRVEHKTAD